MSLNEATKTARQLAKLRDPLKNMPRSSSSVEETQEKPVRLVTELPDLKKDSLQKQDILNFLEKYQMYVKQSNLIAATKHVEVLINPPDYLSPEVRKNLILMHNQVVTNCEKIFSLSEELESLLNSSEGILNETPAQTQCINLEKENLALISNFSKWIIAYKKNLCCETSVSQHHKLFPNIDLTYPSLAMSKNQFNKQSKVLHWAQLQIEKIMIEYIKYIKVDNVKRATEHIEAINRNILPQLKGNKVLGKEIDPDKIIPRIEEFHSKVIDISNVNEQRSDLAKLSQLIIQEIFTYQKADVRDLGYVEKFNFLELARINE